MFGKKDIVNPIALITLVFLSSLLFGCFRTQKVNQDLKLVLYKHPNFLTIKDSINLYEISSDTLYFKTNVSYWSKSILKYSLINRTEKEKIKLLLKNILKKRIKPKYTSISHDIPYSYEIKTFDKSKEQIFSTIYSDNYPASIDSIFTYVQNIVALKKFKPLVINHTDIKIRQMVHNLDTFNLSNANSYLIWKKLNISSKNVLKDNSKAVYKILCNYWIDYKGKRIENLATDNLQDFYYELDNKFYSFKLEEPLQIKP